MYFKTTQNAGEKSRLARASGWAVPAYRGPIKRVFDVILSIALLPVLVPVIAVLALLARRDGGPAFFGHYRVGRDGQSFKCWKIRTMVPDAAERLEALLAEDPKARAEWESERKLSNDPRITGMGAFLRKSSLDELPQIWNVLKGEMSLIGPRPVPEDELNAHYGRRKWAYQAMRPGVTGLWQVSGRNEVSYNERIALDIGYYRGMSLALDMKILGLTVGAVLNRTGR